MASALLSPVSAQSTTIRRARIVNAAAHLFAAMRYDVVQIDDVARAAGVAKPTLYRYFATKEELFLEAFDALLSDVAADLAEMADRGGEATQTIAEMVRILLEKLGGNKSGARLLDGSEKRFGPHATTRLRAHTRHIRDSLAAAVKRGIDIGEFRNVDPDFVALAILGSLRMMATRIPSRKRAAAARTIASILIEGISSGQMPVDSAPSLQAAAQIDALGAD